MNAAPTDPIAVDVASTPQNAVTNDPTPVTPYRLEQAVVVSVVQSIGEPRYPSFMGIRKASKAEIPVWSLSDIGASAPASQVTRTELMNPPSRESSVEIITGESPAEIARSRTLSPTGYDPTDQR